jgi:adenine phosphoribosyltransferase
MKLEEFIRDISDFPKPGVIFKDITPLLKNHNALNESIKRMSESVAGLGITHVAAIESRGFIFGAGVAMNIGAGFVPIRKPGKLPAETIRENYELEYGFDGLEMHKDALREGDRVLLVDDVLATGGTMCAAIKLVEFSGAMVVKIAFLIELSFLKGREKLPGYDVNALIIY